MQAARLADDFLGIVLGARATQEQAIVLSPPYVDAARQLLAEEIVKREDSKHAAVYLSAVFYAVKEEADTPLSSEDIEAAKHQWVQVCFIEPDILIFMVLQSQSLQQLALLCVSHHVQQQPRMQVRHCTS